MPVLDLLRNYEAEVSRMSRARPGGVDEYFAEPLPLLVVSGHGLPHGSDFMDTGRSLRALASEVMGLSAPSDDGTDVALAPLEAVFPSLAEGDRWTLRIALPSDVTAAQVSEASTRLDTVGKAPLRVELRAARETLWLQTLVPRRRSADEGLALIAGFARSRGYPLADNRHELLLGGLSWGSGPEPDVVVRYRVLRPVTVRGRAAAGLA